MIYVGTTVSSNPGLQQHIWWHAHLDTMLGHIGDALDAQAQSLGMSHNYWIYRHNAQRNTSALVEAAVRAWITSIQRGEAMRTADLNRWLARYALIKQRANGKKASIYLRYETMTTLDELCALLEHQPVEIPHLRVRYSVNRRMLVTLAIIRADAMLRRHKVLV